jgi:hypothetical protein
MMTRQQQRDPGQGAQPGYPSPTAATGATRQQAKPCGCGNAHPGNGNGAGAAEPECCGLDCLVQPRFFCGQLLTDADLTAFLDWTKNRFRLSRYRDGWGVVCGLDVHCARSETPGVIVTPGYAVTCCGNDVIVCEDTTVAIDHACGSPGSLCTFPTRNGGSERNLRLNRDRNGTAPARAVPCGEEHLTPENCAPEDLKSCELDLVIRYQETPAALQSVLRGGACGQSGQCEPSRTNEGFTLEWRPATDPQRTHVEQWCSMYRDSARLIGDFASRWPGDSETPAPRSPEPATQQATQQQAQQERLLEQRRQSARDWLITEWHSGHPRHHFCIPDDAICAIGTSQEQMLLPAVLGDFAETWSDSLRDRLILLMVLDRRLAMLAGNGGCDCAACDPTAGVPLARVYAEQDAAGHYQVTWVDPFPPHRRPLSRDDCWPSCPGTWNLGRFIWRRVPEVATALAELGFQVACQELGAFDTDSLALKRILEEPPIVGCAGTSEDCCPSDSDTCCPSETAVCVYWTTAIDDSRRVIAISRGNCRPPRQRQNVSVAEARAEEAAAVAEALEIEQELEIEEALPPSAKRPRGSKKSEAL